jgi:N-acetylmuramoyl-L-alanine amidase
MRWIDGRRRIWPLLLLVLMTDCGATGLAQQTPPPAPPAPSTDVQSPTASMPAVPAAPRSTVTPRFMVVLDAAHGGSDTGARFSSGLLEKDITLSFSVRLRSTLSAHGIGVITSREADGNLSSTARAEIANGATASACILIHATATGSGVHLYTSSLAPGPLAKFMPWQTAQSAYVTQSLKLSSEIDSALAHAEIPVTLGRTSLQPMDSFACPTVAVEIAPLQEGATTRGKDISDIGYQKSVIDALTAAIDQWRNDWRQQP